MTAEHCFIQHIQRADSTWKEGAMQELLMNYEENKEVILGWGVIPLQPPAASSFTVFYYTEKQTASLSSFDYVAPVILSVCSALYRLVLKGWSQAQIVMKVCV